MFLIVGRPEPPAELLAERGEGDLAAGPLEQPAADLAFEGRDQATDARLRHVQPQRGPAEMQLVSECEERLHLGHVHI